MMDKFHLTACQSAIAILSFSGRSFAVAPSPYVLVDNYSPSNFFDSFGFFTLSDPTNGFVQYVNRSVAESSDLISTDDGKIYMGVDTINTYDPAGRGRPSVRLSSKKKYTHGLYVIDLNHIPFGCGVWPAFWSYGDDWPNNGEIDIVEGVHLDKRNGQALHTSNNCSVAGSGQTGTLKTTNCYWLENYNSGCASTVNSDLSYGEGFNSNGGGVYAMQWTSDFIRAWFFPRGSEPLSIQSGSPDPSEFGTPATNWQGSCNIDSHFNDHNIIFDTTFCGDYAGGVYSQSTCPQSPGRSSIRSCEDFVAANPEAFVDAYWEINNLKVYQNPAAPTSRAPSPTAISTVTPTVSNTITVDQGKGQTGTPSSLPLESPTSIVPPFQTSLSGPPTYTTLSTNATPSSTRPSSTSLEPSAPSPTQSFWPSDVPITCPAANNTQYLAPQDSVFLTSCDSISGGPFLDFSPARKRQLPNANSHSRATMNECIADCETERACVSANFLPRQNVKMGTCMLSSGQSVGRADGFVYAVVVRRGPGVGGPSGTATATVTEGSCTSKSRSTVTVVASTITHCVPGTAGCPAA